MNGVVINNLKTTGTLTAAQQRSQFGNAILSINTNDDVLIKDTKIGQNGYNAIEIGLNSIPGNITIENVDITGELNNNGILVFATQDNAVITIKNCKFNKLSNMLRISNRTGATGVIVNIENCEVNQWEQSANYAGAIILEDYTSTSKDVAIEANLFADMKINITNLKHNGKVVVGSAEDICTTKNASTQVIYMCYDKAGYFLPAYDEEVYPEITVK